MQRNMIMPAPQNLRLSRHLGLRPARLAQRRGSPRAATPGQRRKAARRARCGRSQLALCRHRQRQGRCRRRNHRGCGPPPRHRHATCWCRKATTSSSGQMLAQLDDRTPPRAHPAAAGRREVRPAQAYDRGAHAPPPRDAIGAPGAAGGAEFRGAAGGRECARRRAHGAEPARRAIGDGSQQRAALAQADYMVEQHIVRAPDEGRIVRRYANPGMGASTLNVTPMFELEPHTARIVRAELEERSLNSVRVGMRVEIVPEADPSEPIPAPCCASLRVRRPQVCRATIPLSGPMNAWSKSWPTPNGAVPRRPARAGEIPEAERARRRPGAPGAAGARQRTRRLSPQPRA